MTGENATLDDLQEELKAAEENIEDSAAFPKEFTNEKNQEIRENNPVEKVTNGSGTINAVTETVEDNNSNNKRKIVNDNDFEDDTEAEQKHKSKKKMVEYKCGECQFKCFNVAELSTHQTTTHGQKKRLKVCDTCAFTSDNVWEMDFHCKSRGHKMKKDDSIPCKKCDYLAANKDDSWAHKKVHIPPEAV